MAEESAGPKKPGVHPPTSEMVDAAIETLKERGGSSFPAIKKYLAVNYKVDVKKMAPFIKKYLKSAVASGKLIQTKGVGATGSFKFSDAVKRKKAASEANKAATEAAAAPKKLKAKRTYPKISEMVNAAIKTLNERDGSSFPAIKKYLAVNYKVDVSGSALAPNIRKYLTNAVASGKLILTKGMGASGSFKLCEGVPKRVKPAPSTSVMVDAAIETLKERGGSSFPAIKKYLAVNYEVDVKKMAPFIKKYLKSAVASGKLIQTKGVGATGSFKFSDAVKREKAASEANKAATEAAAAPKKLKAKRTYPKISEMVNAAIKTLNERDGSSFPVIKKYLAVNYKVDAKKMAPYIKKYLYRAVVSGKLIQTKGMGASGSFKLCEGVQKRVKPAHPSIPEMINVAIETLKERGGSSYPAIKKYLAVNYKVDVKKMAPYIKKHLLKGVASGKLIQTKGKDTWGSFKLTPAEKKTASTEESAKPKKIEPKVSAAILVAKVVRKVGSVDANSPKDKKLKAAPKSRAAIQKKASPSKKAEAKK